MVHTAPRVEYGSQSDWNVPQSQVIEDRRDSHRAGSLRCLLLGGGLLNHQWLEASGEGGTECPHST